MLQGDFPLSASSLEESLRRLQDQLQHNLMQQSYLLNGGNNAKVVENSPSNVELAVKSKALETNQQQLMLRIQWIQQQLAIAVSRVQLIIRYVDEILPLF